MSQRRSTMEMIGEGVREFGVLFAVFVPLENVSLAHPESIWLVMPAGIVIGVGLFSLGVYLERR